MNTGLNPRRLADAMKMAATPDLSYESWAESIIDILNASPSEPAVTEALRYALAELLRAALLNLNAPPDSWRHEDWAKRVRQKLREHVDLATTPPAPVAVEPHHHGPNVTEAEHCPTCIASASQKGSCPCGCTDHQCDHSGFYVCEACPPGCHGTEPAVTEALRELISAVAVCPDALMNGNGDLAHRELYRWWWDKAAPALQGARAVLAATASST